MRRSLTPTGAAVGLLLLTGCGSGGSLPVSVDSQSSCKQALVQQLRAGMAAGASATPGTRPPACVGVSDAVLQRYAMEAMAEVFGGTDSAAPLPSISAATQFDIPDLTGMTLDMANGITSASGEYTTPELSDGSSPTIANPSDWTVCAQQPAGGQMASSNGIIVTVIDTGAGLSC